MKTTVIVPTYDSLRTIRQCLESIRTQNSQCDLIVVDRFSKDGTLDSAEEFGAEVIRSRAGRSEARNIGLKHSRTPGVLFVDSDMILSPDLTEQCEIGLTRYDALLIPEQSSGLGFWAECKAAERKLYIGDSMMEAARCFRREALIAVGGYDGRLEAGEDWDLQNRILRRGFRVGRVSSTIRHDEGRLSLLSIARKKYLYGKSFAKYLKSNRAAGIKQINPFKRIVVVSFRVLPASPRVASGIVIMKSLEFASAGLGHIAGNS